jgi:hypothetical protein
LYGRGAPGYQMPERMLEGFLYEINTPHLVEQATEENKEKMKVDHVLMGGDGPPEHGDFHQVVVELF